MIDHKTNQFGTQENGDHQENFNADNRGDAAPHGFQQGKYARKHRAVKGVLGQAFLQLDVRERALSFDVAHSPIKSR